MGQSCVQTALGSEAEYGYLQTRESYAGASDGENLATTLKSPILVYVPLMLPKQLSFVKAWTTADL